MNTRRAFRPELECLEDRVACSVLAAGFQGQGVWRFTDPSGWQQLSVATPVAVAADDNGDVAASFSGSGGVWRFENAGGWVKLTGTLAAAVGIDDTGRVVADLGVFGIWRF